MSKKMKRKRRKGRRMLGKKRLDSKKMRNSFKNKLGLRHANSTTKKIPSINLTQSTQTNPSARIPSPTSKAHV